MTLSNDELYLEHIHNYMGVDLDEVWDVIENDLPQLKRTVQTMLNEGRE